MGLRFRQTFTLFPGVRLNVGKRGMSASFGVPGATLNLGPRGVRSTVGLPGTGLSYSSMISPAGRRTVAEPSNSIAEPSYWEPPSHPGAEPNRPTSEPYIRSGGMREIGSAAVESLTSAGLLDFRTMIVDARTQRREIEADLSEARAEHGHREREQNWKKKPIIRVLFKKRIAKLEELIPMLAAETERLEGWLEATHIQVQFDTDDAAQRGYGAMIRAFDALRGCGAIWDVTSDRDTNRVVERTAASRELQRRPVVLDYSKSGIIRFGGKAMSFANANGEDVLIYPGMILMQRGDGEFALIDLRDVTIEFGGVNFIEEEHVPEDTQVVRHTWAKVNKDGSPDRRFKDNYQIPVCLYGKLKFTSNTGLTEEYQFSNAPAAVAFGQAFEAYKAALRSLGDGPSKN